MNYISKVKLTDGTSLEIKDAVAREKCKNVTYSELVLLRSNAQLIPGQFYRITDYMTTTAQVYTQSAGHLFDIIVRADSTSVLNENAHAAIHEGDTYFANSDLAAWELTYTLDNKYWSSTGPICNVVTMTYGYPCEYIDAGQLTYNDKVFRKLKTSANASLYVVLYGSLIYQVDNLGNPTTSPIGYVLFSTNVNSAGKGTITRLKDEFGNECGYDFKNIQYCRIKVTDQQASSGRIGLNNQFVAIYPLYAFPCNLTIGSQSGWAYTFSSDASFATSQTDTSIQSASGIQNNIIEFSTSLNNIVMYGTGIKNNVFKSGCKKITIGSGSSNNTFGPLCEFITAGSGFSYNFISRRAQYLTAGREFKDNYIINTSALIVGNYFVRNTLCNTTLITAKDNVEGNTFYSAGYISLLSNNEDIIFNPGCAYITISKNFVRGIVIEFNTGITITSTATTSSSNYLLGIIIKACTNYQLGSSGGKTIYHNTVNDAFCTTYQPANSQIIEI